MEMGLNPTQVVDLFVVTPAPTFLKALAPPAANRKGGVHESRAVGASHLSLSRCHPRGRNGRKRRTLDVTSEPQGFKH